MSDARLRTNIWIQAVLWRCSAAGVVATIVRRGDADAGAVLVKMNRLGGGFEVLTQTRLTNGSLIWTKGTGQVPVDETTADAYIARQTKYDPDLWIIEIEDRAGRNFLDADVT